MVQSLSDIRKSILDYVTILEAQGIHVEKTILYGSYSRGTAHEGSDVDVVILSSDLQKYPMPERLSLLSRATLNISLPLEVIGYTPQEISGKSGKSIFWDEICQTGREMYSA